MSLNFFIKNSIYILINRTVDITLVKVNPQKYVDWITSFDFNNYSDILSAILEYQPYLYLSMSSSKTSNYFWLIEIDLILGTVLKTKWFNVLNGYYLKILMFSVVMISEDFLFTLQDSMHIKNSTASINTKPQISNYH